ncbi:hypothetical protein Tsubulata_035997 [Turnera subulata]|uniref:Protein kinase domain-containing protein n=1 Tax=Turnera subulata TaxID=218843 RepID=A0A9Q0FB82_9ROSI|nr:hypothetical protein Tsubulata_035997 [Turnera subulata]
MAAERGRRRLLWSNAFAALVFLTVLASQATASTDHSDVVALQDQYNALNKPPQLKGWKLEGGDPCQEFWTGVSCNGSSVIYLELHGLNLTGFLGVQLHLLLNLKHLDFSHNYIYGVIPFGLPPNATVLNLACNNLTRDIPHSLTSLRSLRRLNLSHNSFSGPIGNVFTGLQNLKVMDLSYNDFSGDLPSSFGSLTNLTTLFLQNNQFTGSVVYLAGLPLADLNIQSNHFSGLIPNQFQLIQNLWMDGNTFQTGANYAPWKFPLDSVTIGENFSGPPSSQSSAIENSPPVKKARNKKKRLGPGGIACVLGGLTFAVTCAAIIIAIRLKQARAFPVDGSLTSSGASPQLGPAKSPLLHGPRHLPSICPTRRSFCQNYEAPISAKVYTVEELQSVTNNFSEENLLGAGSLGSVYRAEFPDGQVLVVKNISTVSLSFQEEEQLMEVIWTASRLRHPNIVTLVGYCVEHGHHLLVYEYITNITLDDVLHTEAYRPLPWNIRLNIALGVARALDYLHSVLTPPVAHGNIKASNVLLDEEIMPRLSDCGLAVLRSLTSNSIKLKASEIAIDDTGYIAPEHGEPGTDNTKSDIFAFGVLLLELLTGRRAFDSSRPEEEQSLVKWASCRLHDNERLSQMVDPRLKRALSPKILSRFADIVSLCIQSDKFFRPPISEIVDALNCLLQKFTSSTIDGVQIDPFDRSFRSTRTRFLSSPSPSHHTF